MSIRGEVDCPGCGAGKLPGHSGCEECLKAMPEDIPGARLWRVARYRAVALGAKATVARIDLAVSTWLHGQPPALQIVASTSIR